MTSPIPPPILQVAINNRLSDPTLSAYVLRDTPGISDDLRRLANSMQMYGCVASEVDWLIEMIEEELGGTAHNRESGGESRGQQGDSAGC